MSRQCACGGVLTIHQLTGEREAWTCRQCGRYEAHRAASLHDLYSTGTACIIEASLLAACDETRLLTEELLPGEPGRAASTESDSLRSFLLSDRQGAA